MDPNAQQPTQPVAPQQPPVQEPPVVSKHSPLPKILLILLVVLIAAAISGAIFYMLGQAKGQQNLNSNPTTVSTTTQTKVSAQPTTAQISTPTYTPKYSDSSVYTNTDYGFRIEYPKSIQDNEICTKYISGFNGLINYETIDDPTNNGVYIVPANIIEAGNTPDGNLDTSTCKLVSNSLDITKNGYNVGTSHQISLYDFEVFYTKVSDENDLTKFVHTKFGPDCSMGQKTLDPSSKGVYDYTFRGPDTNVAGACQNIGGVLKMWYSPANQSAVYYIGQSVPFNASDGQTEPVITFLK